MATRPHQHTTHFILRLRLRLRLLSAPGEASRSFWRLPVQMAAHAAKKRRPEDEAEEEMHLAFRGAANALSQVYTQAVAHQKVSFLAGEYRGMESVYRWISSQHEEASDVSVADVLTYLQNEIEQRAEDMPASSQHPSLQPAYNFPSANVQMFRIWPHQLAAKWKWSSEQPFSPKPGLHALQFVRALHGYES